MTVARSRKAFWDRVAKSDTNKCWPFTGPLMRDGYGRVSHKRKLWLAHRLAWFLTYGDITLNEDIELTAHGVVIRHTCDNPACCNPNHLQIGTQLDNIKDRVVRNRNGDIKGAAHPKARLSEEDIKAIRFSNKRNIDLAREYNATPQHIRGIRLRLTWRHI